MKNLYILILSLLSLGASAQLRFLQADDFEDYELVLKSARQNHHLILMAVHDRSGDFRQMYDDGVFNDAGLNQAAKAYTTVAIDIQKPMGERFESIFSLNDLPAFYIMNEEEFVLDVLSGYQSAQDLRSAMAEAAKAPFLYDTLVQAYQAKALNDQQWLKLLELYAMNFDFRNTTHLAQEYLNGKSESELLQQPAALILSQYGVSLETIYPTLIISNTSALRKSVPKFELSDFLNTAIEYNLDLAIVSKDSLLCENICEKLVVPPLFPKDSLEVMRMNIRREFAWQSGQFALYTEAFIKKQDSKAPGMAASLLFDEAYDIVENFNSTSALNAALKMANRSDEKESSFRAKMLKAYIAYLQEDSEQAKLFLQDARSQVKSPQQLRNLDKLQELVNEQ
ncbi:hypothetical protein [Croceimicrobium hydrocarbonivorans]|uniref:DUF255 domain-containing protein n=1 Tax=Croceimicrobium hydrocarbonivorans TaxID=2761580 RepID=A0A7H0VDE0_9FLAO|nr:hypothetical protein [Croceimicrobium hydrocarbonivorans]QNR23738.1 hypothetical protein H4K34_15365 [Croceimicrobium hydrocarbonivorans]